jgi:hypothetical protein
MPAMAAARASASSERQPSQRDGTATTAHRLNGRALKPIHDWVKEYERLWSERFDELDAVLEELKGSSGS